MLVTLKCYHEKRKKPLFIANTIDSVLLKLKLAVLGHNWEEHICLRHQDISAPLDGIDSSKTVDNPLLEVSAKIGRAKSEKELQIFNAMGFDYDQELRELPNCEYDQWWDQ